ncbi:MULTISPECIES: hypothetical protein [unclassified Pseudomonas]|uniref:hypothetical protein n=1 Tax=unclassified Pseudomonas TaxID=196821 RepID=UPI0037F725CD
MNDHTLQGADLGSIAFHPSPSEALGEGALVQYLADPLLLPSAQRHWSTGANGTIDSGSGRYRAGRAPQGTRGSVDCVLNLNGITLTDSLSVSLGAPGVVEDEHWRALKSFVLRTPDFGASVPPWMFNNGRQQLHLSVDVSTQTSDEEPGALDPDELKTLALFELGGHQPLAILNATQEPALSDTAIYWAVAEDRNTYELATQQQPSQAEPDQGHLVSYFVHCLEPKDQQRTFYAGVRDRFGFWHYSDRVGAKSTISIRPAHRQVEFTVARDKVSGFDKPAEAGHTPYDYNFHTVEYWIFTLSSGNIHSWSVKGGPRSMLQWEREHSYYLGTHIRFVSYTGIIAGGGNQQFVTLDESMLRQHAELNSGYALKFNETHWAVPAKSISSDSFAVSLHRAADVSKAFTPAYFNRREPLEIELIDDHGNSLTLQVAFSNLATKHKRSELTYFKKDIQHGR